MTQTSITWQERDGALLYQMREALSVSPGTKSLYLWGFKSQHRAAGIEAGEELKKFEMHPVHPPVQSQVKYFIQDILDSCLSKPILKPLSASRRFLPSLPEVYGSPAHQQVNPC